MRWFSWASGLMAISFLPRATQAQVTTADIMFPFGDMGEEEMSMFRGSVISTSDEATYFVMSCYPKSNPAPVCNGGMKVTFVGGVSTFNFKHVAPAGASLTIDCQMQGCPAATTATCTSTAVLMGRVMNTVVSFPLPTEKVGVFPLTLEHEIPAPTQCPGGASGKVKQTSPKPTTDTTSSVGLFDSDESTSGGFGPSPTGEGRSSGAEFEEPTGIIREPNMTRPTEVVQMPGSGAVPMAAPATFIALIGVLSATILF